MSDMKRMEQHSNTKQVYINGYFTKEHTNGVPRYACEIVKRLDIYFKPGEAILVVPKDAQNIPKLSNISICKWEDRGGKEIKGVLWGEYTYRKYIEKKECLNVNFTNRGERFANSITTLHDLVMLDNYKFAFKLPLKKKIRYKIHEVIEKAWLYHKLYLKKKYSIRIVTVSETSRQIINKKLNIPIDKISVIGNGWEHILEIESRDELKDSRIHGGQYYFSVGNIKAHKNFQWILREAQIMPKETFVIAGKIPANIADAVKTNVPNVILLGYISDEYMKFLLENSKGLLFPSLNEGFGIPPIEAMALGTPVAVSDIPIMHEIFEDAVGYFNPFRDYKDFGDIFSMANRESVIRILKKHSWEEEGRKWYQLINENR